MNPPPPAVLTRPAQRQHDYFLPFLLGGVAGGRRPTPFATSVGLIGRPTF
jgi:hypothetical protein